MTFSLAELDPTFQARYSEFLALTNSKLDAMHCVVVPYFGVRNPWAQAILWRQSRHMDAVLMGIAQLHRDGAPFLAQVLADVGPQQPGPWRTNALPGASWHQFGTACDHYIRRDGRVTWDVNDPAYGVAAECARDLGLTSGMYWERPDSDHVQLSTEFSPLDAHTWAEVDALMSTRFPTRP